MEGFGHRRLQLLANGCTVGVFHFDESSKVFLILSSSGEFTYLRHGDRESIHLLRFIPHKYEKYVKELLDFRNFHSSTPYVCERFPSVHNILLEYVIDDLKQQNLGRFNQSSSISAKVEWTHTDPIHTQAGWECYISDNGLNMLCICPTRRRVLVFLQLYFDAEDVCERGAHGVPLHYSGLRACYDIDQLPPDVSTLLHRLQASDPSSSAFSCLPILCKRCGAEDAHRARSEFSEISPLLERLSTMEEYPFAPVLFERIDEVEMHLKVLAGKSIPMVEAWLGSEEDRGVLSLQGDFAVRYVGREPSKELHLSLLLTEGGYDVNDSQDSWSIHGSIYRYRGILMQMLSYRKHAITMSAMYRNQPPMSSLGLFPENKRPSCYMEQYIACQTKYYVRVIHGKYFFRGVFSDGYMINWHTESGMIDVVCPDGNVASFTLPLMKSIGSQLRDNFILLDSFVKWYLKSPEERRKITFKFREGAALAKHSCLRELHKVNLDLIANGMLDANEGLHVILFSLLTTPRSSTTATVGIKLEEQCDSREGSHGYVGSCCSGTNSTNRVAEVPTISSVDAFYIIKRIPHRVERTTADSESFEIVEFS